MTGRIYPPILTVLLLAASHGGCDPPPTGPADGFAGPAAVGDAESGPRIVGRVVDDRGRPIAGALVQAKTGSMGELLWWAFGPETRTDSDGRFDLPVPFDDIRYTLTAGAMGWAEGTVGVIPDRGEAVEVRLEPLRLVGGIGGTVVDPDGGPVDGAIVELIGEYGLRAATRCDGRGRFVLEGINDYIGQAVPLVRVGGLVAPLQMVRGNQRQPVELALGPGAAIQGVVREQDSGSPISGATVIVRPGFASDFRMETVSGPDGWYLLGAIPPGEYSVTAVAPAHFRRPPRGTDSALERLSLGPGRLVTADIEMEQGAWVPGVVLDPQGRPVAGALVAIRSTWLGDYRDQNIYVATDRDGRFGVGTGHTGEQPLAVAVFHPRHGLATIQVGPLDPGQVHDQVQVKLPGSARVAGTVSYPRGRPIRDVLCLIEGDVTVHATTDGDGRFDLGRISITPGARPAPHVTFRPPRPTRGEHYGHSFSFESVYYEVADRAGAPQFYAEQRVEVGPARAGRVRLDATLQPAELLEISGVVQDADGAPVPGACVWLFNGVLTEEGWRRQYVNPPPMTGSLDIAMPVGSIPLARAMTDQAGRWTVWTVRGDTLYGFALGEVGRYCVGVIAPDRRHAFVCDVLADEGTGRAELDIRLGAEDEPPPASQPDVPVRPPQPGGDG